jgi:hypothetical protein
MEERQHEECGGHEVQDEGGDQIRMRAMAQYGMGAKLSGRLRPLVGVPEQL